MLVAVAVVIVMKPACGSDVFSSVDDDDESDESTAESIGGDDDDVDVAALIGCCFT